MGLDTHSDRTPRQKKELQDALNELHTRIVQWDTGENKVFLEPVDTRIAPDYYFIIKNPIDLGKIGRKISDGEYSSAWTFMDDMWLLIDNCLTFNRPGSFHHRYAQRLIEFWEPLMERLMLTTLSSHLYCCGRRRLMSGIAYRCRASTCFVRHGSLYWQYDAGAGEEIVFCHTHYQKLLPEIKIPRFTNGTGGDITFLKTALVRKRHNAPFQSERFVFCDTCGHQDHEICRMYDAFSGTPYRCGQCIMEKGSDAPPPVLPESLPQCHLSLAIEAEVRAVQQQWLVSPKPAPVYVPTPLCATPTRLFESAQNSPLPAASSVPTTQPVAVSSSAAPMETNSTEERTEDSVAAVKSEPNGDAPMAVVQDGPDTSMSRQTSVAFLRSGTGMSAEGAGAGGSGGAAQGVESAATGAGAEAGSTAGQTPLKAAVSVDEECPDVCRPVYVRVVDHVQDKCEVKPNMRAHYPDCITEFPYIRKVVLAFINLDDRPMCFFGMIVQEYGEDAPLPNKNCIYLSLLDSMKLPKNILPSGLRTAIYHAIVRRYLRVVGDSGFATAHIYTCPPRKGQNYIFPFKPDHQKEISLTRLRQWYADLLNFASVGPDSAILGFRTISDAFPSVTIPQVPYFDGDNWPDIIEDILKVEDKVAEEEKKQCDLKSLVDKTYAQAVQEAEAEVSEFKAKCVKPRDAGGYFEGFGPHDDKPRKRRKISRSTKPKLSPDTRLVNLMTSIKKDFLVVQLRKRDPPLVHEEPQLPVMGDEHSVISFLKAEKLEFSTLRHAKFSTMLLLRYLIMETKPTVERWPPAVVPSDAVEATAPDEGVALNEAKGSSDHLKKMKSAPLMPSLSADMFVSPTARSVTPAPAPASTPASIAPASAPVSAPAAPAPAPAPPVSAPASASTTPAGRPPEPEGPSAPVLTSTLRTTTSPLVVDVTVSPTQSPSPPTEKPCGPTAGATACVQPRHEAGTNGDVVMAT